MISMEELTSLAVRQGITERFVVRTREMLSQGALVIVPVPTINFARSLKARLEIEGLRVNIKAPRSKFSGRPFGGAYHRRSVYLEVSK